MHEFPQIGSPASQAGSPSPRSTQGDEGAILAARVRAGRPHPLELRPAERWTAAMGGTLIVILFVVARMIAPSDRGYGSHQSLGLPACTSVALLGMRCPTCGMSTAWANFVGGRWAAALRANVTGSALAMTALPVWVWLTLAALEGRWRLVKPTPKGVIAAQLVFIFAALAEWIVRLWTGS